MENKMNFFQKIKGAVCDTEAYLSFAKQGLGKGILYIFLLSIILGGIVSIKGALTVNKVMNDACDWVSINVPHFALKDGELQVDGDMPIKFESEDGIVIIDTENNLDPAILNEYASGILVTRYEVYSKKTTGETRMIPFENYTLEGLDYTGQEIAAVINTFKGIIMISIVILGICLWFLGKLISLLTVVGIGGIVTGTIVKCKTNYELSCKIGAYTLTAPMFLKCLISLVGIKIPFFFVIYYVITFIYMGRAIKAMNQVEAQEC